MYEEEIKTLREDLEEYAFYKAVFSEDEQEATYHYMEYTEADEKGIAPNILLREGETNGIHYRILAFSVMGPIPEDVERRLRKEAVNASDSVIAHEVTEPKGFSSYYDENGECGADFVLMPMYKELNGIFLIVIASEEKAEIDCPVTVFVIDESGMQFWPVASGYIGLEYETGSAGPEEQSTDIFQFFGTVLESAIGSKYADDPDKQEELRSQMNGLFEQFGMGREDGETEPEGSSDDWAAMSFEEFREVFDEVGELQEQDPITVRENDPYLVSFAALLSAVVSKLYRFSPGGLEPDVHTPAKERKVAAVLEDAWEIKSREDLIDTLDWLFKAGQTEDYRLYYESESLEDMVLEDMEEEEVLIAQKEFAVVKEFRDMTDMNTMLAWDLGRAVMLARWGYFVGLLTRKETEQMLKDIAVSIVQIFDSWRDFGKAYLFGGLYWSYPDGSKADTSEYFIDMYHMITELLGKEAKDSGEWKKNPWIKEII